MSVPCALAIAGSDSGGGAGIQADLKTFAAFGVHGTTSITAVTAQNTREVSGVYEVAPAAVAAQIDAVMEDIGADAAKTGMLVNAGIVEAVADRVRAHHLFTLVVDPVMVATTGAPLLDPGGVHALKTLLLPRAHVVTPNLAEASALAGRDIESLADMRDAARAIQDLGPRYVVIKGGHLAGEPIDLLYTVHDFIAMRGGRIEARDAHGTGCIFAAAITALLAKKATAPEAVAEAKSFTAEAIRHGLRLGHGSGPANPLPSVIPSRR